MLRIYGRASRIACHSQAMANRATRSQCYPHLSLRAVHSDPAIKVSARQVGAVLLGVLEWTGAELPACNGEELGELSSLTVGSQLNALFTAKFQRSTKMLLLFWCLDLFIFFLRACFHFNLFLCGRLRARPGVATQVFGHKIPDTDTVCSAIVQVRLLKLLRPAKGDCGSSCTKDSVYPRRIPCIGSPCVSGSCPAIRFRWLPLVKLDGSGHSPGADLILNGGMPALLSLGMGPGEPAVAAKGDGVSSRSTEQRNAVRARHAWAAGTCEG